MSTTTSVGRMAVGTSVVLAVGLAYVAGRWQAAPSVLDLTREVAAQRAELHRLVEAVEALPAAAPQGAGQAIGGCSASDPAALAAQLRPMMAEEIRRAAPPTPPPRPEPIETEENLRAYDKVRAAIDRAKAAHVWRNAEKAEFQQAMPHLTSSEVDEVTRELIVAINSQELPVRTDGPPF